MNNSVGAGLSSKRTNFSYAITQAEQTNQESDCLHTRIITETSGHRREHSRTDETNQGICEIQGLVP